MRIAIVFILLSLTTSMAYTQAIKRKAAVTSHSQKEIAAQKDQAMNDFNAQIKEQEKLIAEAKANNEDAETIGELEKQLALMKKMSSMISKVNTNPDPRANKVSNIKYPVIKYVSPIVPIPMKQALVAPSASQAKDRLLWYVGKKVDDTTLITSSKTVVRYSKKRNMVIVQPDPKKDSTITNLVAKLSKTESLKNNFALQSKQIMNSLMMYPEILKAYQEYDLIRKRLDELARNTIQLPSISELIAAKLYSNQLYHAGPNVDFNNWEGELSIGFMEAYQQLLQMIDKAPSLDVPAPPKRPNDLCLCDQQTRDNYENQLKQWMHALWDYEDQLLQKVQQLHRYLADNNVKDISQTPNVYSDLDHGIKLTVERRDKKLEKLLSNYADDVHREEALVQVVIATEREKQKLGLGEVGSAFNHPGLFSSEVFEKYIGHAMEGKDYNVVFDYSLYLSHEYHKQLFGGYVDADQTRYFNWLKRLESFNRFKLTIDLDFEHHFYTDEDHIVSKATGIIKSDPILVSVGRKGCKWQLFIHDTNYEKDDEARFRIPFKVISGTRYYRENQGWKTYPYSGPKDAQMVFPSFRISFCQGAGPDTALFDVLRYKQDKFNVSNPNPSAMSDYFNGNIDPTYNYTLDLLGYANLMFIGVEKSKANVENLVDLGDQMMDVRNNAHVEAPTGNAILDQLQIEYSVNQQQHEMQQKLTQLSKVDQTVFTFDAHNNSDVLIDQPINTAHTELNKVSHLERGIIKIKVVHAPTPGWDPRNKFL